MKSHTEGRVEEGTNQPVLLVVDDAPTIASSSRKRSTGALGVDYRVLTAATPWEGLTTLERLAREGVQVALVAADLGLAGIDGVNFLGRAHALQLAPDAPCSSNCKGR